MKSLEEVKAEFLQLIGELSGSSDIKAFMEWLKDDASDEILANCNHNESMTKVEKKKKSWTSGYIFEVFTTKF